MQGSAGHRSGDPLTIPERLQAAVANRMCALWTSEVSNMGVEACLWCLKIPLPATRSAGVSEDLSGRQATSHIRVTRQRRWRANLYLTYWWDLLVANGRDWIR